MSNLPEGRAAGRISRRVAGQRAAAALQEAVGRGEKAGPAAGAAVARRLPESHPELVRLAHLLEAPGAREPLTLSKLFVAVEALRRLAGT